jgi:ribosome biogenesis GTPase A
MIRNITQKAFRYTPLRRSIPYHFHLARHARPYNLVGSPSLLPVLARQQCSWQSTLTPTITSKNCPGCGAPFQEDQPDQPGYLVRPNLRAEGTDSTATATAVARKKSNKTIDHDTYESLVKELDPSTLALLEGFENTDKLKHSITQEPGPSKEDFPKSDNLIRYRIHTCQRCHQLVHNNRTEALDAGFLRSSQQYTSLSFLQTKQKPVLLYIMDITNMPWSLKALQHIMSVQPEARVMIAANKIDLLPPTAGKHEQRIRDYILMNLKQQLMSGRGDVGILKSVQSITLVSAKKGWGMKSLIRRVQQTLLPTDDLYVVGSVNAGKSALINQLLGHSRSLNKQKYRTTSSVVPGTTMGMIRIPLHVIGINSNRSGEQNGKQQRLVTRDHFLIDTPGIIDNADNLYPMSLMTETERQELNKKQSTMKPATFRLYQGQSLVLGRARIDVLTIAERPILMTLFTSLSPHITKTVKLEQQESDICDSDRAMVPLNKTIDVHNHHNSHASVDLAFAGLGWIALTGGFGQATLQIWLPKNTSTAAFYLREPSFLPYEYNGQIRKFFGSGERAIK